MQRIILVVMILLILAGFWLLTLPESAAPNVPVQSIPWEQFFADDLKPLLPVAESFALPLFPPSGEGTYVKRGFGEQQNLGEDWALEPDREQPQDPAVCATADGVVILADDFGKVWGQVVILLHRMPDQAAWPAVESMYANLATLRVHKGEWVTKGEELGRLGATPVTNAPELHFEIRTELGHMLGPGEADLAEGWVNPSKFIEEHQAAGTTEIPAKQQP